jgi:uncharacterized small protein (DUF1192 family)
MDFCYHCQQRHGKNYECDAVKVLRYEKLQAEIAALREENERLKKQALDWKKWPERPNEYTGAYIVRFPDRPGLRPHMDYTGSLFKGDWDNGVNLEWAEIPEPEDR